MRWRSVAAFWACLLCLGGCSLAPPVVLDKAPTASLPIRHEITATPFFDQDAYQCGPAALAMVLGFHRHPRTPQQLAPWMFTPDAKGSFPAELDAVSRREGFVSYPLDRFDALLQEVAAGHPVLVLQNLGTDWLTQWHFAVVVGFDLERQELVLRSGDLPRRLTPFAVFDTTWKRGGRWGRVILPPQALPATASPLPYLKAVADLEQTGPASAALAGYRTAAARWPDQPEVQFGLGTALLGQHDLPAARLAFETLLALQPDLAAGWNNYAYTLQALDCPAAASAAIDCALRLAPDHPDWLASRAELPRPTEPDPAGCLAATHSPPLCPAAAARTDP